MRSKLLRRSRAGYAGIQFPETMTEPIPIPAWLAVAGGALALWTILERAVLPATRRVVRRRMKRTIQELNTRLQAPIPAFHQTKRRALIERLTYDPQVLAAVQSAADATGAPRDALMRKVEQYAGEIVPAFNAYAYFRLGHFVARRTARYLYRVRLGYADEEGLSQVDPKASIVFVMNHRSNMDYIIVSYMAMNRCALSFAVGEWAYVWPLRPLIRSLGAFFVRRNSGNPLYRQVLSRYVQYATAAGVAQAVYPEGGLSRDGRLQRPKLGLINYMTSAFDPRGERDLVFIPVGINYDRVLEDRFLLSELDPQSEERSKASIAARASAWAGRNIGLMLRKRWFRYGYACVHFGKPISMRAYVSERGLAFAGMDREARFKAIGRLGGELLEAIAGAIPVLPAPLVATVFARDPTRTLSELEVKAQAQLLIDDLERRGAYVHIPRADRDYAVSAGLRMLTLRRMVIESDGLFQANASDLKALQYYANSICHFFGEDGGRQISG